MAIYSIRPESRIGAFFGIGIWLGGNVLAVLLILATLLWLPRPWAVTALAFQLLLLLIPLRIAPPKIVERFLMFSVKSARSYFPITVVYEDKDAFKPSTAYLIGYEPHSVLPLGMNIFTKYAADTPSPLRGYVMGTSTVFLSPLMRHLCWWLGIRPASRDVVKKLLAEGTTCALCPGGVQECLYMQEGLEVAFLRKRTGFVKIALELGVPLVPAFSFGQTPHYTYARPLIDWPSKVLPTSAHPMSRLARRIGYLPMLAWGWMGTALPRPVPMYIVVGKPIEVPRVYSPSLEQVHNYLDKFISALQHLFETHKAQADYPQERLVVY